jgi:hypothetical protein
MTKAQAEDEIEARRLIRKFQGVYKIGGVPDLWQHGPMAAYLAVGGGGAARRARRVCSDCRGSAVIELN